MYNPNLLAFIEVANCGSITKASKKLFISSTAVMKQINTLENTLNLQLFNRTKRGVTLTDDGKVIYKEAKYIIDYSNSVLDRLRSEKQTYLINIGTSILCPCKPLMDIWSNLGNKLSNFKIKIIPFDDDNKSILNTIEGLGNNIDLIVSSCDSKSWLNICNFHKLGDYHFCIAIPKKHYLSKREIIHLSDLKGQTVMIMKEGESKSNTLLRNDIEKFALSSQIIDAPYFYDLETFNKAEENGTLLITLDCWKDLHPSLVTLPLDTKYKIPYGILYSKNPKKEVLEFLKLIKD